MIVASLALLVAGGALFVAFRQMKMFEVQLGHMEKALKDSGVMASAADASAKATLVGALAAQQAAETAHSEFIAANRPKLFVRDVQIRHVEEGLIPRTDVDFEVANRGNTKAYITSISMHLWKPKDPENIPAVLPYATPRTIDTVIDPGYVRQAFTVLQGDDVENLQFNEGFAEAKASIGDEFLVLPGYFLIGYIVYRDEYGRIRRTAIFRRYDLATKRFTPIENKEYEYQD